MTKKSHVAALSLSLLLLSACNTTPNRAPVVDRPAGGPAAGRATVPAAPVNRDPALYTVKKGDTLIRIALEYGQNYRDLVAWNNLSDPNAIEVDQVLRVVPPAAGGALTSAIVMPPSDARPLAPAATLPRKSTPRGDKRPYSEAALAELRAVGDSAASGKPDGAAPVRSPSPTPPAAVPPATSGGADEKLSWAWPTDGKVVAGFDEGKNKGLDITGRAGQQVVAAGAGKVMYAGSGIRGYGNLVIVKHNNSLLSAYAHNRSILVKEGQNVSRGQAIAEMGDSDADAVKLHFEIRQQGKPVDPAKFLPPR